MNKIALIMPVYNEADSIEATTNEIYHKILERTEQVELHIFEDGSNDGTKEILRKLQRIYPSIKVFTSNDRKGYPKAMRDAFLSIDSKEYPYVISIDSDGQYDPDDFFKIWEKFKTGSADIVMGQRISRAEPVWRRFLSWGLRILEGMMFPIPCRDITSVMRMMSTETAHKIVKDIKYSKFNFWLEFTALMALNNYRVIEIPVAYRERVGGSKVYGIRKMPRVILAEFRALREVKREWRKKEVQSQQLQ